MALLGLDMMEDVRGGKQKEVTRTEEGGGRSVKISTAAAVDMSKWKLFLIL